jgi:hypothetical protein
MKPVYHFTFEKDWRTAPLAFWVHVPVAGSETECEPPAPAEVPHLGYQTLWIQFERYELQFSAPAQLDHFIEVLSSRPMPTSRQLSARRGLPVGPNGHWLSRLPAELKSPRKREKLVNVLRAVREQVFNQAPNPSIERTAAGKPSAAAHVER